MSKVVYHVIDPSSGRIVGEFTKSSKAKRMALNISKLTGMGVEIRRTPEPYYYTKFMFASDYEDLEE